ncbi:hypothetical protein T02_6352 [Trichinella nativa]|uniref:Uncharacterized protein n=1 Tax=Trichinella nativa TaxID=6335 RepID=A0A0V1KW88_9BILA|nr:hypothetical protein T02_6352 [Trichinella nativa]
MTVEMVEATKTKGYELAVRQNGKICNQTHSIGQTEKKGKKKVPIKIEMDELLGKINSSHQLESSFL